MKLLIRSKPESFYRAKMKFIRQPVEVDVDADTATILMNEPMLSVTLVQAPARSIEKTEETPAQAPVQAPAGSRKQRSEKQKSSTADSR